MSICPYCNQGVIVKAKIKIDRSLIQICEECDTVWNGVVNDKCGVNFELYMKENYKVAALWEQLELLD